MAGEIDRRVGRLLGKRALITGAGQGIGHAAAVAFGREGARVCAADVQAAGLDSLATEMPSLETVLLDVTDGDAIGRFAADAGAFDILFNCAGWVAEGSLLACTEREWDRAFDVNVKSMFLLTGALLPAMRSAGRGGSVINMASVVSSLKGAANRFAYGASKGAVIGLTKSIAIDFVADGIRCNAICPGTVDTPSLAGRIAGQPDPVEARKAFVARQPLGRFGTAAEIAELAVYLASDESAFTTGSTFVVDGGWSI